MIEREKSAGEGTGWVGEQTKRDWPLREELLKLVMDTCGLILLFSLLLDIFEIFYNNFLLKS